jgi:hypothetical protein
MCLNSKFLEAVSVTAKRTGCNAGELYRDGLADFLRDGFRNEDSPQEIAARALAQLCGGRFDPVVAEIVTLFLVRSVDGNKFSAKYARCAKDLCDMVRRRASYEEYLGWANSNFH